MTHLFFLRGALRIAALLSLVGLSRAADPSPPSPAHSTAELRAQFEAYVSQPRFNSALWGVKVTSLDSGRVIYEHHADRRLSPASNAKLSTAALALVRLGGDYRIVTPILATAAVGPDGELKGDVVISGRGDPSWKSRRKKTDFWATFEPFITALQHAGVRHIAGDLVADASFFHSPPHGAGWTADDLNDYYGAEISAITLEENYVDLRVAPAASVGAPCTAEWLQPSTGLVLDNRATTVAAGNARHIRVLRFPGENLVHLFGELPLGDKPELTEATVPRPAEWFAVALKEALTRRGIRVDGRARSVRWPEPAAAGPDAIRLGEISSPPLRDIVAGFLKPSQNLETDLIFAYVGEMQRTSTTPSWRQSDELAVTALKTFLQENALHPDDVTYEEGSGLSRNDLTTAAATVSLLEFIAKHREHEAFLTALPIAGVDGTLRKRMKGTVAEGNVRAKTGTLRWANALSGHVTTAAGEHLVFSFMLNRNLAPSDHNAREDLDDLALMLARYDGKN